MISIAIASSITILLFVLETVLGIAQHYWHPKT